MSLIYRIKTKVWITKPKKTKQKKATFNSEVELFHPNMGRKQ